MANKKRLGVIIATVLAAVMTVTCFGTLFSACGVDKGVANGAYIVKQGKSDYEIVIPDDANDGERNGSKELQLFFEKATGIVLPIVTDSGKTEGGKYFSIGNTSFVPDKVKQSVEGLKSCGYAIKTVGDTVYLLGPTGNGTLYSVYGYLARDLGFEYYFTDVYTLNKGVGDLRLTDFDVTAEPDIDMMTYPSAGIVMNNSVNKMRFNGLSYEEVFITANGTTKTHNLWWIMPKSNPICDEHKDFWYADGGATACFTAHGNAEEYAAMQEYFLGVIKDGMAKSSASIFQIAQPDYSGFCNCNACSAKTKEYGGASGIMIEFCNDLCKKVYEWFDTEEGAPYKRDFKLVFLAYQSIAYAPTSENIKCDDNVGIYLAFDGFYSSYGLHEIDHNESFYNTVTAWSEKTHNFLFWIYDVNFEWFFYPYDTSAYKQDYYRLMKEVGTIAYNDEGQHSNSVNMAAWGNLKNYITCKLHWDVDANVEVLTKDFFRNCYKDAWEIMYNVYSEFRAHWKVLKYKAEQENRAQDKDDLGSIFGGLSKREFWGLTMLESWVAQFKDAIKAIEPLKQTDKGAYDTAYMMICGELICPMSIILDLYKSEFSERDYRNFANEFKSYVSDSYVEFYADGMGSSIDAYYEKLGI